jgi:RNA polymerase sigma-70 factor (ECF subfamily)
VKDRELIRLFFIEGKEHYAFQLIVKEYAQPLYWLIRRIVIDHQDADDILQETFIKIYQNLKNFEGKSSLYSWMYRIATNEALGFLRKKKHQSLDEQDSLIKSLQADPYFDGDLEYVRFLDAVKKLPEKQKLVFQLKYFEKLKYEEISEIVGGSVGSLKASYHHAKKKLEKTLGGN